jgi:hypothetical protein
MPSRLSWDVAAVVVVIAGLLEHVTSDAPPTPAPFSANFVQGEPQVQNYRTHQKCNCRCPSCINYIECDNVSAEGLPQRQAARDFGHACLIELQPTCRFGVGLVLSAVTSGMHVGYLNLAGTNEGC